jgi:hypothetical protein
MEGRLHKLLKHAVAKDLKCQKYTLYYEPPESPINRLLWHSYRPDILGVLLKGSNLRVVLVECETKPNQKRVLIKTAQIRRALSIQKQLNENHSIIPLLAIPSMNLHKVNFLEVRRFWEIWIVNRIGEIMHKIFRII